MDVPHYTKNTTPFLGEKEQSAIRSIHPSHITHPIDGVVSAQLDGRTDYYPRVANRATGQPSIQLYSRQQYQAWVSHPSYNVPPMAPPPPRQPARAVGNAVNDLLPYCTTEPPLNGAQVIALSDVVGNLRELALLALGAASGAAGCMEKLEGAVGPQAAGNIAEFFADEWEIEG